jgi:hypothetical protein
MTVTVRLAPLAWGEHGTEAGDAGADYGDVEWDWGRRKRKT